MLGLTVLLGTVAGIAFLAISYAEWKRWDRMIAREIKGGTIVAQNAFDDRTVYELAYTNSEMTRRIVRYAFRIEPAPAALFGVLVTVATGGFGAIGLAIRRHRQRIRGFPIEPLS